MAAEDLDFVVQLGDYIYEGPPNPANLRSHEGVGEPLTLENYRNRHAQYKTDADLQACHAAFPWLIVPDDHEIDNNWADEVPQDPALQSPEAFLARRAAAFRAYYEHMPLRRTSVPTGIDIQLHRRLTFGDLVDVYMLDTRQYRSDQNQVLRLDPNRTILGDAQEQWLLSNLAGPTARWNVLAQQVFFSQRDFTSGPNASFSDDAWDNYVPERNGLRDHPGVVRHRGRPARRGRRVGDRGDDAPGPVRGGTGFRTGSGRVGAHPARVGTDGCASRQRVRGRLVCRGVIPRCRTPQSRTRRCARSRPRRPRTPPTPAPRPAPRR